MKALIFNQPGLKNLFFGDYQLEELKEEEVLIETRCVGVNPIDYYTVSGFHGNDGPPMNINPFPHIPGSEIAGIVKKKGDRVNERVKEGDRVIIYNRIFDKVCRFCRKGFEMLCKTGGGIVGVATNGGFAEYIKISQDNIIKIPDNIDWELAASLPVAGLTAFNAIKESGIKPEENLVIFGGSGNTGQFCSQIGKIYGARTISISNKHWIKEFGVDNVIPFNENIKEIIKNLTGGEMADIVINSLGEKTWDLSMEITGKLGRIISFGVLTGGDLHVNGRLLYNNQITIKGTTGGSIKDLYELIELTKKFKFRTKIWKRYKLEESSKAVKMVFDKDRDGRIMIINY